MTPWKTIVIGVCIAICIIAIIVVFATHSNFGEYGDRLDAVENASASSNTTE